jgi:hypothetical protein
MLSDFAESLGDYVYGYKNPDTGSWDYIGKGKFKRCLVHVEEKGLDYESLYIIARNLEKFEHKSVAFTLESFLISLYNPSINKIDGHYPECFVMAKFSELFDQYKSTQYDNFETFPDWYIKHYDVFRSKVNVITIKGSNIYIESKTRENIQMMFTVDSSGNPEFVRFAVWRNDNRLEEKVKQLYKFLESNGYNEEDIRPVGKREFYEIDVDDVEEIVRLFDSFMG